MKTASPHLSQQAASSQQAFTLSQPLNMIVMNIMVLITMIIMVLIMMNIMVLIMMNIMVLIMMVKK